MVGECHGRLCGSEKNVHLLVLGMIKSLIYEWKTIARERWLSVLFLLFFGCTLFAVRNGREHVGDRAAAIDKARHEQEVAEEATRFEIDSIARGLKRYEQSWLDPRMLSVYGQRMGRVVAMDPQPLAFVSTGQSDLFTHYTKPKLYGEAYALGFSELSNPVKLLFGSFDLAFVCIYLLPLLVVAFSYNVLSAERESGSLRLTLAQPISVFGWLLRKFMVRFVALAAVVVGSMMLAFLMMGLGLPHGTVRMVAVILSYAFFWFALSFWVNVTGKSSGSNAVKLMSAWIVVVLLLPAIIGQLATQLYPVPSRINMIHQYRVAEAEADKRASEILKTYYRDHPELARQDSSQPNRYQFWIEYFASIDLIKEAVMPVVDRYNRQLASQQAWVDQWRFASPAILLQDALTDLSGTSARHYSDFRQQVIAYADAWRSYFMPRMFRNEWMTTEALDQLPRHTYQSQHVRSSFLIDLLVMVLAAIGVLAAGWVTFRRLSTEQLLAG